MIKLLKSGTYQLLETKNQTKILVLDHKKSFAWVNATGIGEILITSHKSHDIDTVLSMGKYKIYSVKDSDKFVDLHHLELFVGTGTWQGYLLPTGIPTNKNNRNRIIPTDEVITRSGAKVD